jgi:hypothetical protein
MYEEQGVWRQQLKKLWDTNPQVRSVLGQEALVAQWRQYEARKA